MKVVCAGTCKTGTKSMREALEILGYENVQDAIVQLVDNYDLWMKYLRNKATTEDFQRTYQNVDSITDIPGSIMSREIIKAFPTAKVVLTIRKNKWEWLKSFKRMIKIESNIYIIETNNFIINTLFCERFCPTFYKIKQGRLSAWKNLFPGADSDVRTWGDDKLMKGYRAHNSRVATACDPKRLLVFNVEEGWEPLCNFLGKPVPNCEFPKKNVKHDIREHIVKHGCYDFDKGFTYKVKFEVTRVIVILSSILILILSYSVWNCL